MLARHGAALGNYVLESKSCVTLKATGSKDWSRCHKASHLNWVISYGLLLGPVSVWTVLASKYRMIDELQVGKGSEGNRRGLIKVCNPRICLEEPRKAITSG